MYDNLGIYEKIVNKMIDKSNILDEIDKWLNDNRKLVIINIIIRDTIYIKILPTNRFFILLLVVLF